MSKLTVSLTYGQARAVRLRLAGKGYGDIARDLKLDGCLISYMAALREARELLDTAVEALDVATGWAED